MRERRWWERWRQDTARGPGGDALRVRLHQQGRERASTRLARGAAGTRELIGETRARDEARRALFAVGDRVQFTDTRKARRFITAMSERSPASTRAAGFSTPDSMDRRGAPGREVAVGVGVRRFSTRLCPARSTKAREDPRPHYSTTRALAAAASYVALTRQRESATNFCRAGDGTHAEATRLQMARGEVNRRLSLGDSGRAGAALRAKADAAEATAGKGPKKSPRKTDDGRGGEGGRPCRRARRVGRRSR